MEAPILSYFIHRSTQHSFGLYILVVRKTPLGCPYCISVRSLLCSQPMGGNFFEKNLGTKPTSVIRNYMGHHSHHDFHFRKTAGGTDPRRSLGLYPPNSFFGLNTSINKCCLRRFLSSPRSVEMVIVRDKHCHRAGLAISPTSKFPRDSLILIFFYCHCKIPNR